MAQIIKVFREKVPAMRFIGKKYPDYAAWGEWFSNAWFDVVENSMGGTDKIIGAWENGGAYIGLECRRRGELLEYWIGMFTPENTKVPEGFAYMDFPEASLGTCWIYGREEDVHGTVGECREAVRKAGPRFTTPDEKGNVILDYCYFVR